MHIKKFFEAKGDSNIEEIENLFIEFVDGGNFEVSSIQNHYVVDVSIDIGPISTYEQAQEQVDFTKLLTEILKRAEYRKFGMSIIQMDIGQARMILYKKQLELTTLEDWAKHYTENFVTNVNRFTKKQKSEFDQTFKNFILSRYGLTVHDQPQVAIYSQIPTHYSSFWTRQSTTVPGDRLEEGTRPLNRDKFNPNNPNSGKQIEKYFGFELRGGQVRSAGLTQLQEDLEKLDYRLYAEPWGPWNMKIYIYL